MAAGSHRAQGNQQDEPGQMRRHDGKVSFSSERGSSRLDIAAPRDQIASAMRRRTLRRLLTMPTPSAPWLASSMNLQNPCVRPQA